MKTILHKIAYDILFLTLVSFCALIVSEVIFPGFLTQFISFTQIVIALTITLLIIVLTHHRHCEKQEGTTSDAAISHREFQTDTLQKKTAPTYSRRFIIFWTVLTLALTALTMTSFAWWEILIILSLVVALLMFLWRSGPRRSARRAPCRVR